MIAAAVYLAYIYGCYIILLIIWLLHNLVEASFDLFRFLLPGDQLKPWELHPLVSYTKVSYTGMFQLILYPNCDGTCALATADITW